MGSESCGKWAGAAVEGAFDVVVVGAGIMGSCTAYEVAKRGHSVLLLEQFDFLHRRGSSHGESRIIRMTYPEDYYTAMMATAYSLWEAAHEDAGFSVLTATGGLDFGPVDNPDLQAVIASCQKHGVVHEMLSAEEVAERFPIKLAKGQIAVFSPEAGILHATKACAMFQQLAQKHGAVLRDRAEVTGIEAISSNSIEEGGVLVQVTTSRGVAVGRQCVVAAGAWTKKLIEEVGGVQLSIQPIHTTVAYWQAREPALFSVEKGFPLFINYDEPFIYGMPSNEYPGLLKISLHAGPPCDPDTRALIPLIEPLKEVLRPWIAEKFGDRVQTDAPVIAEACMYSMTPDQDFILDSVQLRGAAVAGKVFVAAGFSGHGFKLGPLVGSVMADLALTGGSEAVPLELFSIDRFRKNPAGNEKVSGPQVRPHPLMGSH